MIQRIIEVDGYSQKTATQLVKHLPTFINKWLKSHPSLVFKLIKNLHHLIKKVNGKMKGPNVIFTGVRDTDLEAKIIKEGGTIVNSITSKTTLLITKDLTSNSSKIKKAKELGVTIIVLVNLYQNFHNNLFIKYKLYFYYFY